MVEEKCGNCKYYRKLIMWPDGKPDYDHPKHCCVLFVYGEKLERLLCGSELGCVHEASENERCEEYIYNG